MIAILLGWNFSNKIKGIFGIMKTHEFVLLAFSRFKLIMKAHFRLGDPSLYNESLQIKSWHISQNQYLKTEDDVKVNFGALLIDEALKLGLSVTIHSEMPVYTGTRNGGAADLSIHKLTEPPVWRNKGESRSALLAAIEIKCVPFLFSQAISNGGIEKDIEKLSLLSHDVSKYCLIIDEARMTTEKQAALIKTKAKELGVHILSNNSKLTQT